MEDEKEEQDDITFMYLNKEDIFKRKEKLSDLKEDLRKKYFLCKSRFDNMRITYKDKDNFINMIYDTEDYEDEECKIAKKFNLDIPTNLTNESEKEERINKEILDFDNKNKNSVEEKVNKFKMDLEEKAMEECYKKIKQKEKEIQNEINEEEVKYGELLNDFDKEMGEKCKGLLEEYVNDILEKNEYEIKELEDMFNKTCKKVEDNLNKAAEKKLEKFVKIRETIEKIENQTHNN